MNKTLLVALFCVAVSTSYICHANEDPLNLACLALDSHLAGEYIEAFDYTPSGEPNYHPGAKIKFVRQSSGVYSVTSSTDLPANGTGTAVLENDSQYCSVSYRVNDGAFADWPASALQRGSANGFLVETNLDHYEMEECWDVCPDNIASVTMTKVVTPKN